MAFIRIINKFILVLLFGTVVVSTEAQKTVLKFNPDGTFKIVQFTDVHFKYGNPNSDIALERMRQGGIGYRKTGSGDFHRRCDLWKTGVRRYEDGVECGGGT